MTCSKVFGIDYTVAILSYTSGTLNFVLDPSGVAVFNNDQIRLVLDGRRYSFGDANISSIGFYWTNHGLRWSSGDTVSARLVQSSAGPTLQDAEVEATGTKVTLNFRHRLSTGGDRRPLLSAFTVKVNGTAVDLDTSSGVESPDEKSFRVTLLDTVIYSDRTVTVSYTDPSGGNDTQAIQDTYGDDAESFTDVEVDNNSVVDEAAACQAGDRWCATMTVGERNDGRTYGYAQYVGGPVEWLVPTCTHRLHGRNFLLHL